MTSVEYRNTPGFPGYRVSSDGRLWSFWTPTGQKGTVPRPLKPTLDKCSGYFFVALRTRRGVSIHKTVHRLVLETFVGPCPDGMHGCHQNDVKTDNRLSNLRWDTPAANIADAVKNGRIRSKEQRQKDRIEMDFVSLSVAAKMIGKSKQTITSAVIELGIQVLRKLDKKRTTEGLTMHDIDRIKLWLSPKSIYPLYRSVKKAAATA